jgi:predicted RecA/RadA family phage recombinase
VHKLAKVGSQAWTVGALVYWDNTNKRFTTTASGNLLAGCAAEAASSGAGVTTGVVRLNGIAQADAS